MKKITSTESVIGYDSSVVREHNSLSRLPWKVNSIWELRLVLMTASMIKRGDKDFKTYKYNVRDLIVGSGRRFSKSLMLEINEALKNCMSNPLSWCENDRFLVNTPPLAQSILDLETGDMEINFSPKMKPFYFELESFFNDVPLQIALCIPSIVALKLYRYLWSWRNVECGFRKEKLEVLHELLAVKESYRKDFSLFRKFILQPAQAQIESKTPLRYMMEPIYEQVGRVKKVCELCFWFKNSPAEITAAKVAELKVVEAKLEAEAETCYNNLQVKGLACRKRKCKKCDYCLTKGPKFKEAQRKQVTQYDANDENLVRDAERCVVNFKICPQKCVYSSMTEAEMPYQANPVCVVCRRYKILEKAVTSLQEEQQGRLEF